ELPEWIESLGQDNVRQLSVQMLIDLFTIETNPSRAAEIATDMEATAEDLLMSGSYPDALRVVQQLQKRGAVKGAIGSEASRQALDRLGESLALRETVALIGDVDDGAWKTICGVLAAIGAASVDALKPVVAVEQDSVATQRAEELIVSFGPKAVNRL